MVGGKDLNTRFLRSGPMRYHHLVVKPNAILRSIYPVPISLLSVDHFFDEEPTVSCRGRCRIGKRATRDLIFNPYF